MLVRYKQDERGKSVAFANIYTPNEHHINPAMIDRDAVWAVRKLQASGAEAYLVGGAVRDLLLGLVPKDFDITTSASPRQIQRLFWNARIIGKRFKLVHLVFNNKILEVSTFRSGSDTTDGSNNVFGSVDQDAKRRDFSINSLYYDPSNGQLLDFNHAMEDFKHKRITSIIDLNTSFEEDPVRMIRAIKYSVTTGFRLRMNICMAIRKYSNELSRTSTSRLTEEVSKILASGRCCEIFTALGRYKLLVYMLPCFSIYCKYEKEKQSLRSLDKKVLLSKNGKGPEVSLADMLVALVDPLIVFSSEELTAEERFRETYRQIKVLISPMTPSNYEVEAASLHLLSEHGYKPVVNNKRTTRPAHRLSAKRPGSRRKRSGEFSATRKKQKTQGETEIAVPTEKEAGSSAEVHDL